METFTTLKLEQPHEHILVVTLNRPEVRDAINSVMMNELGKLWRGVFVDHGKIRCIILTGANPAFCAGADLKERNTITMPVWKRQHAVFEQAMLAMLDCPVPIIVAVNGAAFGGGLELTLACDFAYAANTATFSQSEVKIGLMPGAMGTQHLPKACGIKRAKELTFTGAIFSAQEAHEWDIVNKLCESNKLMEEVMATAKIIASNAPLAVKQAKKSLNMSQHLDVKTGFFYEIEAYNQLLLTKDRTEGIRAFNEKRVPVFTGE